MDEMIKILKQLHFLHSWEREGKIRWCTKCGKGQRYKTGKSHMPEMRGTYQVYWWETMEKDKYGKNVL